MEGTHRRFAFRNGKYVDAYSMARLRSANFGNTPPTHSINKATGTICHCVFARSWLEC
jgi:hypothetical protein